MLLLAHWGNVGRGPVRRLGRVDLFALGLELIFFLVFLGSMGTYLLAVVSVPNGIVFVLGTLLIGILFPLALQLRVAAIGGHGLVLAAMLVLLGGFVLRFGILTTPPALLEHPNIVAIRFGPEDGRPRGGGPGADPGNSVGNVEPPSKITGTR
jgi:hypothetical protein